MDQLVHDVRLALRGLSKRPAFAAVAIVSVAIGVGANTALFSIANAVLLRPVPGVSEPERVVELHTTTPVRGFVNFSYPDFLDLRAADTSLEHVAGWDLEPMSLSVGGAGQRVTAMYVSPAYFDVVGVDAARGRTFLPAEDAGLGQHPVTVLSHRFWHEHLGADPDVIGTTIELNRIPYTIVGVGPEGFGGHLPFAATDLWVPMAQYERLAAPFGWSDARNSMWLTVIGRLSPGATVEQAQAAARQVFGRLEQEYPTSNEGRGVRVDPFGPMPAEARPGLRVATGVLIALLGLVLAVVCANVAGMMLARSANREREIAIRLALGSGRLRLVRHLLTEAVVLFSLGGTAGILVAYWGTSALSLAELPIPVQLRVDFAPDTGVLALAIGLTLVSGVLFGLVPALGCTRPRLVPALKAREAGGRRSSLLYRVSVGGQVGVSVLLLTVAGLFLRALHEIDRADPGFVADGTYVVDLDLTLEGREGADSGLLLLDRILEEAAAMPGSEGAAVATNLPLDQGTSRTEVVPEERAGQDDPWVATDFVRISEAFFATLRVPLLQGRGFLRTDDEGAPGVVIVNRAFADRVWPGQNPVGRRLNTGPPDGTRPWLTVVGVVGNAREEWLNVDPEAIVYFPLRQSYSPDVSLVVRAPGGLTTVAQALRQAVLRADSKLSLTPVMTLDEVTALGTLPQRIAASAAFGLGALAMFLSAIGVYGVLAFAVGQRTREIGLRMALGASRGRVLGDIGRWACRMVAPGMVVGALLAIPLGRAVRPILYGVSPADPAVLAGVVLLLTAVVAVAGFGPARRATRVDPMQALRYE